MRILLCFCAPLRHSRADMSNLETSTAALGLVGVGSGMAFYEWSRIKAGRPLLQGRAVLTLYWVVYLLLIVLGIATGVTAIVR
jgi:hypothetical protein